MYLHELVCTWLYLFEYFIYMVCDGTIPFAIVVYIDIPSALKSATLAHNYTWQKNRRQRLHHACIEKVADMVNKFGSEDKYLLCADGQVQTST
jgi:hypothetical protein